MNFWIDKLEDLIETENTDSYFGTMSVSESILTCCVKLWNYRFKRTDRVNFTAGKYVEIDEKGSKDTLPPIELIKRLCSGKDQKEGLKEFKELIK